MSLLAAADSLVGSLAVGALISFHKTPLGVKTGGGFAFLIEMSLRPDWNVGSLV
jgi:hypothetical protein